MSSIRIRDRDALLQALRAGVVPRTGQQLIQVGRSEELKSLIADIDRIADGSAIFRLVIGEYGSGKTFFLNLVRAIALEKKLVVANADLNPDRRLHSSSGQTRSLYSELMRNLATRSKPEGAIVPIVEKFIASIGRHRLIPRSPNRSFGRGLSRFWTWWAGSTSQRLLPPTGADSNQATTF